MIAGISLLIISCHKIIQYRYMYCLACVLADFLRNYLCGGELAVSENYICGGEPAVSKDE